MLALGTDNGSLALIEKPYPKSDDEAVVRVILSGICNTDLEIARGYAGFHGTLGHEFVGIVESSSDPAQIGRRVVGEINAGCGTCPRCLAHDPRHCTSRTVLGIVGRDGAHAEFLSLPPENLLILPDDVSDVEAVFVEPLAAAWGITESVAIGPESRVAVIGDGKLGLLCAQAIATNSRHVTLIGKHQSKLDVVSRSGIETVKLSDADQIPVDFDVAIEASGSESGFALAVGLLRPKGTLVLKSTFHGKTAIDAAPIVVNELKVIGSRCGRFAPAIDLLLERKIDVAGLVSGEFPLKDGLRAFELAAEPGVLKILLRP